MESWKDLHDLDGFEAFEDYRISSLGRVQTRKRQGQRGEGRWVRGTEWKDLTLILKKNEGYFVFGISAGKLRKVVYLHFALLLAFGPPKPFPGAWVLHRDDVKTNNSLSNLYWGTPKQNSADRDRNGHRFAPCGEDAPWSKLTEAQVREIMARPGRYEKIAAEFEITDSLVSMIKSGARWGHLEGERVRGNRKGYYGNRAAAAKLTDDQARELHRRANAGENQRVLALEFGISQQNVSKLKSGVTYRRVINPPDR